MVLTPFDYVLFFFNDTATTEIYTLSLHDALPISLGATFVARRWRTFASVRLAAEFKGTRFVTIPDTSLATICPACDGRDLLGGSVTLAVTHVVSAPLAVSHQDGFSWSAFYRRRQELGGTRWSSEAPSRVGL